jgi:hypothetical protein
MDVIEYEAFLAAKFSRLDASVAMAFALCCADRLRRELTPSDAYAKMVEVLTVCSKASWSVLDGGVAIDSVALQAGVVELIPDAEDIASFEDTVAHFAGLSMAYAVRCVPEEDFVQNVIWSARGPSDCVDSYAARFVNETVVTPAVEAHIAACEAVQREASRQQRDLRICVDNWRDRQEMLELLRAANGGESVLGGFE